MLSNLKKLFSSWKNILIYLTLTIITLWLWWNFTDIEIMFWNYGPLHTYTDIGLSIIMILGFPLFLIALIHRGWTLGNKENLSTKTGAGLLAWIIGTIISGCSCCGLTLAAYFGLLPLMNFLPYDGLEIKIVATLGMLYAIWDILRNLESCKMPKK